MAHRRRVTYVGKGKSHEQWRSDRRKGMLVIEALPFSRLSSGRPAVQILWKTILYSIVVLLFKVVEESIPLVSEHGGVVSAAKVMYHEVSWPLFVVLALWIIGGLLIYCLFF